MPARRSEQLGEVSRNGGWKGSPNSIAALLRCQVPRELSPKCRKCGHLALSGKDLCRTHSGRGRAVLTNAAGRGESRLLARLERLGLLPLELLVLPVWRGLLGLPTPIRAPMRLALVMAWDKRDKTPLYWSRVQREALELGGRPGPRQNTAYWYENV